MKGLMRLKVRKVFTYTASCCFCNSKVLLDDGSERFFKKSALTNEISLNK